MLRCPFNNFSKCEGACPFSTENFNACKLASLGIAIEGLGRGTVAQLSTVNAHLVEMKGQLEALKPMPTETKDADSGSHRVRPTRADMCYVAISDNITRGHGRNVRISLNDDMTAKAQEMFGERCDVTFVDSIGLLILSDGDALKLSTSGHGSKSNVSIVPLTSRIERSRGKHHYYYLEPTVEDGAIWLRFTGEVEG